MSLPGNWSIWPTSRRIAYAIGHARRGELEAHGTCGHFTELGIAEICDEVIAINGMVPNPKHTQVPTKSIAELAQLGKEISSQGFDIPEYYKRAPVSTANEVQVGGDHYRLNGKYQIWDLVVDMGWAFFQGNVISYVHRYRQKGGVDDLRKARHYLDKMIEIEEAKKSEGEKS